MNNIPDDELESALNHYKAMLRNNRQKISRLEQELQTAAKKGGAQHESNPRDYDDDAASQDTPFNVSDIEEASDLENSEQAHRSQNQRNLGYFFENKIKDFEMRCVNGLGELVFQQGYDFIKSKQGLSAEELRPYVTGKRRSTLSNQTDILGENLIGYWHLIDQMIFYENFLEEAKSLS